MGGMMGGGGGKGGGGGSGSSDADKFFAQQALGQNETAIHNRYQQLGLGIPAGGPGAAAGAAASGGSLSFGSPSTMEQMDIGTIPTESGGAMGMADALMGQLFNPQEAAGLGPTGSLAGLAQQNQQQESAGFAAGGGGFFGGGGQGGGAPFGGG